MKDDLSMHTTHCMFCLVSNLPSFRFDRYNLDNCLFIFNVAGNDGGGALYLLSMASSDLTGIVTFTRSDEGNSTSVHPLVILLRRVS